MSSRILRAIPIMNLLGLVVSTPVIFTRGRVHSFFVSTPVIFTRGRLGFFLFCFWPGEVSSVASSGPFLDLAFVQVILVIVVILLIERSPCFCHGLTFPFSSPQILSNRLRVAVVYYTSWICVLLQRKT